MTEQQPEAQQQPQETPAETPEPAPRRRWPRRVLFGLIGCGLVLFLVIALLPTLAGTGPGKRLILGLVNGGIDGSVEAESLSLNWFGGQKVSGVNIHGAGGELVVDNLTLEAPDASLIQLAMNPVAVGEIQANADAIHLVASSDGAIDLPRGKAGETQATQARNDTSAKTSGGGGGLPDGVDAKITLTVGRLTYTEPGSEPQVIENLRADTELRGNKTLNLDLTGEVNDPERKGTLAVQARIDQLTDADGKVQADKATIDADIRIIDVPTAPFDALAGQDGKLTEMVGPTLTTTAKAKGTLDNFTADAALPDLKLPAGEGRTLAFSSGTINVRPGKQRGDLSLTLNGEATTGELTEAVSLTANASNLFSEKTPSFRLTTSKFPTPLGDAITQMDGKLTETLGDMLDLTVTLAEHPDGGYFLDGRIDAANLSGPFEGRYDADKLITLSTPSPLLAKLSPKAYRLWTDDPESGEPANLALNDTLVLSLDVSKLYLVLRPTPEGEEAGPLGMRLDSDASSVSMAVSIPKASLLRRDTEETFVSENLRFRIQGQTLNAIQLVSQIETLLKQIETEPGAGVEPQADEPRKGKVSSNTTIKNLFDGRGVMAFKGSTIDSTSTAQGVPASMVDAVAGQQGKLVALTGPVINGKAVVKYQPGKDGTVLADLDATHLKGRLPLRLTADGFIELTEDADVSLVVTEETSKSWLGTTHPLLADAVASDPEKPARVKVKKDNFRVPLEGEFDIMALDVQGTIDPGTMLMKRSGWINQAVTGALGQLTGRTPRRRGQVNTYMAQFSPMQYHLKDGILTTSEMWLTADDMGIGFQGFDDLRTEPIEQMSMGILGATLYAIPGSDVRRTVRPDAVLQMPIEGTLSEPNARYDVLAFDLGFEAAKEHIEDPAVRAGVGLLEGILRDAGRQQKEKATGRKLEQLAWNPSEPAQAFADQFKPKPEEAARTTQPEEKATERKGDNPTTDQPAESKPDEDEPRQPQTLQELLEALREDR